MKQISQAQYWAVCHTCELRHPCFTHQNYINFCERHRGHATSFLNRDWLNEVHKSPLAAHNPKSIVKSAFGYLGMLFLRNSDKTIVKISDILGYDPNAAIAEAFGSDTAMTCTLASLASSATVGREGTAVDNTTNLYLDAMLRYHIKLATGTPANDQAVYVYSAGSEDGTNYTDNATGVDASITLRVPTNLRQIGVINTPTAGALTYKSNPIGVAKGHDGILPAKWSGIIVNFTGLALDATEANHVKAYRGVYATVI